MGNGAYVVLEWGQADFRCKALGGAVPVLDFEVLMADLMERAVAVPLPAFF